MKSEDSKTKEGKGGGVGLLLCVSQTKQENGGKFDARGKAQYVCGKTLYYLLFFYERENGETFVFFERDFKHKSIRPPLFRLARESVVIAVEQIFLQGILHFLCCVSNLSLIFACFPFISRAAKGDNNRLTADRREQEGKATKPTLIPPRRKEGTKKKSANRLQRQTGEKEKGGEG